MNSYELENDIKSIFFHYLNDSDILNLIRKNLNASNVVCISKENQVQQSSLLKENNIIINQKLEEILNGQKTIENLLNSSIVEKDEEKLQKYKKENNELYSKNQVLENEKNQLIDKIKYVENVYKTEISKYSIFKESLKIYTDVNSLNCENKYYMESLCGSLDVWAILSLGRDDGKIDQLWHYLRDLAIKKDSDKSEVSKLNNYFEFCLKVANSTKVENERYVSLNIDLGSEFNIETCIRTEDSKQIGRVRNLLVNGVNVGKNIKYQAIVRVE